MISLSLYLLRFGLFNSFQLDVIAPFFTLFNMISEIFYLIPEQVNVVSQRLAALVFLNQFIDYLVDDSINTDKFSFKNNSSVLKDVSFD